MNKKIEMSIKNEIPEIEKVCESVMDYIGLPEILHNILFKQVYTS